VQNKQYLLARNVHAASVLPNSFLAGRTGFNVHGKPNIYGGEEKYEEHKERQVK
jgi:hypothetical protein